MPELAIVVDSRERYGYSFSDRQVTTTRARLEAGDYGIVRHGTLLATVERKSLADLVSSLTTGKLKYQLADLAAVPRSALVVEDRYSAVFKLAQEWTYRFLAAASVAAEDEYGGERVISTLTEAGPLQPAPPTPAEVRAWAIARGHPISDRGRVPRHLVEAYRAERGG